MCVLVSVPVQCLPLSHHLLLSVLICFMSVGHLPLSCVSLLIFKSYAFVSRSLKLNVNIFYFSILLVLTCTCCNCRLLLFNCTCPTYVRTSTYIWPMIYIYIYPLSFSQVHSFNVTIHFFGKLIRVSTLFTLEVISSNLIYFLIWSWLTFWDSHRMTVKNWGGRRLPNA